MRTEFHGIGSAWLLLLLLLAVLHAGGAGARPGGVVPGAPGAAAFAASGPAAPMPGAAAPAPPGAGSHCGLAREPARLRMLAGTRRGDTLCDASRDTPHFRIHYATEGELVPRGWPSTAAIDSAAAALESCYRLYNGTLGMFPPLSDATAGGGQDLCDAYLLDLAPDVWGVSIPEAAAAVACAGGAAGYIEIRNSFEGDDWARDLRAAIAHEYFHILQFGVSWQAGLWWMESTAAWAEWDACPGDRVLQESLPSLFSTPYLPLWEPEGVRAYGSALFWVFLQARTDSTFVPSFWKRICSLPPRAALAGELEDRGLDFNGALAEFTAFNALTGDRDDGQHYPQGSSYPPISCQRICPSLPVEDDSLPSWLLARPTGADYIRFLGPGGSPALSVHFRADAGDSLRVSFVASYPAGPARVWLRSLDDSGAVSFDLEDWNACADLTMIVLHLEDDQPVLPFRFSASESGGSSLPARIRFVPSPFRTDAAIRFRAAGPGPVRITLFDATGRMVRRLTPGGEDADSGESSLFFDGRGENGRRLPAGVYFVRLDSGGQTVEARGVKLQ